MRHPTWQRDVAGQRLSPTEVTKCYVWHCEASFLANLWQLAIYQGETTPAAPRTEGLGGGRHNRLGHRLGAAAGQPRPVGGGADSTQRPPAAMGACRPVECVEAAGLGSGEGFTPPSVREHGTLWRGLYRADLRSTIPAGQTVPLMEDTRSWSMLSW